MRVHRTETATLTLGEHLMDFLYVAIVVSFFLASAGLVWGFERLRGDRP